MSVCGQSGQTEEDSTSEEVGAPFRDKTSDIYKQKPASKVVRVLTVLAYLLSVSLAAILLSVYYICVWKSPDLPLNETPELSARQGHQSDYGLIDQAEEPYHIYGGGDSPINGSTSQSPSLNVTSGYNESNFATDTTESTTVVPDSTPQHLLIEPSVDIGTFNETGNIT